MHAITVIGVCFACAAAVHSRRVQAEFKPAFALHAGVGGQSHWPAGNHPAPFGQYMSRRHAVASLVSPRHTHATMYAKLKIEDVDVKGKRVFIRTNFDVPQDEKDPATITDTAYIDDALPTINDVLKRGAKSVVLASHMGSPNGEVVDELSMRPVAKILEEKLGQKVTLLPGCSGSEVESACADPAPGSVILMENLRWNVEEEGRWDNGDGSYTKQNSAYVKEFRRSIAKCADVYCNNDFGIANRAHSSMLGEGFDVRCMGSLMSQELDAFAKVLGSTDKPVLAILAGAKVTDNAELINNLLGKVDKMIIGGDMAFPFLNCSEGIDIRGDSSYNRSDTKAASDIMKKSKDLGVEIILPVDFTISSTFGEDGEIREGVSKEEGIPEGFTALDCGPKSAELHKAAVETSKTILWSGAMGVFEMSKFEAGSKSLMDAVVAATSEGAISVIADPYTAMACKKFGTEAQVTHVSTGGIAALELLEGKELPGIDAIQFALEYEPPDRVEEASGPPGKGVPFIQEEIDALYEASISTEKVCEPEYVFKSPGSKLLTAFQQPQIFYTLLRKPKEDPPAEAWDKVREKWPVLAERSNAELVEALAPIKAKYVDLRFLD